MLDNQTIQTAIQSPQHPMVVAIQHELENLANDHKAKEMQAYMKSNQPFYGVQSQPRKAVIKMLKKQFAIDDYISYQNIILQLWHGNFREDMYQALEIAEQYKKWRTLDSWHLFEYLIYSSPWWDTLDWIAGKIVSPIILNQENIISDLIKWRSSEKMWVRRASILAHLKHKTQTNTALLGETILILAHEKEFFIRKAIGWILREYGKWNPEWVKDFVVKHDLRLSSLSKKEALKHVNLGFGKK